MYSQHFFSGICIEDIPKDVHIWHLEDDFEIYEIKSVKICLFGLRGLLGLIEKIQLVYFGHFVEN